MPHIAYLPTDFSYMRKTLEEHRETVYSKGTGGREAQAFEGGYLGVLSLPEVTLSVLLQWAELRLNGVNSEGTMARL